MHLAIDTASDEPGIALSSDGAIARQHVWRTEQNQSKELLPNIDVMLRDAGVAKEALTAIFVDVGPGSYAGLRVGVSIAKALAHGLAIPLAGVGRLELDAFGAVAGEAPRRRIVAVHRAGRGEFAWAAYRNGETWREERPPAMAKPDELHAAIAADDIVTGDIDDALAAVADEKRASIVRPRDHRIVALVTLGARRLAAGATDDPRALVPLYLRGPAIGPQRVT
jgi:tRNA threonylcarbamoyladenosine biosynthesis protein TsaB